MSWYLFVSSEGPLQETTYHLKTTAANQDQNYFLLG